MSNTLVASLSSMLNRTDIEGVARNLGESEQAVLRGMELSTSSIFSGLARKAGDSEAMRQVVELASKTPGNAVTYAVSGGQLINPRSSLIAETDRFLSYVFGGRQGAIFNSISRETGLRAAGTAAVLTLGARSVLGFIGSRVREGGLTAMGLSDFLRRESASLRSSLPSGFNQALSTEPPTFGVRTGSPATSRTTEMVAQPVRRGISWLWLLPLALILLGILWWVLRPKTVNLPNLTTNRGSLVAIG